MEYNMVGWFEIPVTDMDRAIKFYEEVFGAKFHKENFGGFLMAFFPFAEDKMGCSGALVHHPEEYKPSASEGVVIYFTPPSGDIANEIQKVENAGGKVLQPKTLITKEIGYMATFLDSEGNRLAMHSRT